jgi:hypothetical protein
MENPAFQRAEATLLPHFFDCFLMVEVTRSESRKDDAMSAGKR